MSDTDFDIFSLKDIIIQKNDISELEDDQKLEQDLQKICPKINKLVYQEGLVWLAGSISAKFQHDKSLGKLGTDTVSIFDDEIT